MVFLISSSSCDQNRADVPDRPFRARLALDAFRGSNGNQPQDQSSKSKAQEKLHTLKSQEAQGKPPSIPRRHHSIGPRPRRGNGSGAMRTWSLELETSFVLLSFEL